MASRHGGQSSKSFVASDLPNHDAIWAHSQRCANQSGASLAATAFSLKYEQDRWPAIRFFDVKDYQRRDEAA